MGTAVFSGALAWVDYDLSSDKKLVSADVLTEPMLLGWYPKMVKKVFTGQ